MNLSALQLEGYQTFRYNSNCHPHLLLMDDIQLLGIYSLWGKKAGFIISIARI